MKVTLYLKPIRLQDYTYNRSSLLCNFLYVIQAAAYGSIEGKLTEEMIDKCAKEMAEQHQQKTEWQNVTPPHARTE